MRNRAKRLLERGDWSHRKQPQPRWGCGSLLVLIPRVARASQPWALGRNPFGIRSKSPRNSVGNDTTFHHPQSNPSAPNPKGIVSFSPGLRGTSYPGKTTAMRINPKGVVARPHRKQPHNLKSQNVKGRSADFPVCRIAGFPTCVILGPQSRCNSVARPEHPLETNN